MPVTYMTVAFVTGVVALGGWLLTGGGMAGGVAAYVLSGNLALAGLAAQFARARQR